MIFVFKGFFIEILQKIKDINLRNFEKNKTIKLKPCLLITEPQFEIFERFLQIKNAKAIRFMWKRGRKEYIYDQLGKKETRYPDSSYKYTNARGIDFNGNEFEMDTQGEKVTN